MKILLEVQDKATKVLKKSQKAFQKLGKVARKAGKSMAGAMGGVVKSVFSLKTAVLGLAGIAGFGFLMKKVLSVGVAFEDYNATLKVVMGSQKKASEAFSWLEDFAKTTPFEIDNLTEAFVKLSAYGIDGTKVMKTLGDTASAMGKDIMEAVDTLASAQTGEFERLKQFGIKAIVITKKNAKQMMATQQQVGMTALAFTDKTGKAMTEIIDRNNKDQITSTLQSIWNSKYTGAMEERSKTTSGLLSNLSDMITGFFSKISDETLPVFKDLLQGWLNVVKTWDTDKTLDNWAKATGAVFNSVIEFFKGVSIQAMKSFEETGKALEGFTTDLQGAKDNGQSFAIGIKEAFNTVRKFLTTHGSTMFKGLKQGAKDALYIVRQIASAIESIIRAFQKLQSLYTSAKTVVKGGLDVLPTPVKAIIGSRASGGGVSANSSYLVGERGAEIFTPTTSGTVSASESGGTSITNIYTNASAHGIDSALASRGDSISRGSRVGLAISSVSSIGYINLSAMRVR